MFPFSSCLVFVHSTLPFSLDVDHWIQDGGCFHGDVVCNRNRKQVGESFRYADLFF
jgi:hypothetical protein